MSISVGTSCLSPSFLPATAVLEMTYECNHSCLFCSCPWYDKNNGFKKLKELSIKEWKETIKNLCEMGVCNIAFTGGEPLLKKGIEGLIEFSAGLNASHIETAGKELVKELKPPKLYLLTNGKVLTDDILKLCKKYAVNLSLSLPGIESFSWHTKNGEARNVLNWFYRAKDMGVTTTAGITVTKQNLYELYETISAALLNGADTILLNRFIPGGRGIEFAEKLSLDREDIAEMLTTAEKVLSSSGRKGSVGTELPKCAIGEEGFKHLTVGTRCSAALDFFVIDPSGYIRVCNHSPVRLNHLTQINELKINPYWKRFVMKDYLPEQCFNCNLNNTCDGGCREAAHIHRGCVDSMDPILSDLNR